MIGGGALGAATAYHLRRLGVQDVVLLERDALASGSTSKSAGGIRAQFADELNIRIALRSLDEFESFADEISFRQYGYLFLLDRAEDVQTFRAGLSLQQSLGVPSRELTAGRGARDRAAARGGRSPRGGVLRARRLRDAGGGRAALRAASRVRSSSRAARQRGIDVRSGRIVGVETTRRNDRDRHRRLLRGRVVPRGRRVRRGLATRRGRGAVDVVHAAGRRPPGARAADDRFLERLLLPPRGARLAFGGRERALEDVAEAAARRLPVLAELPVQSTWWGWYDVSPDWNALVGEAPDVSRFLYATGFSGHGFQQAPAVGEYLAELVVGVQPTLDLSPFSAERFATGGARPETFVV